MTSAYEFDMFSIMPKDAQAQFGDVLDEISIAEKVRKQRALFRDPAAVKALRGASDDVRQCLRTSGFVLRVYDSGAGPGRYPASDESARGKVLGRLRHNLRQLPADADWNGFDIAAFLDAASEARPVDGSRPKPADSGLDEFFSARPSNSRSGDRSEAAPDMDSFFSARPADTRANAAGPEPEPDIEAFFANAPGTRPAKRDAFPELEKSARMSYDQSPPKKSRSLIMLAVMGLGLYLAATTFLSKIDPMDFAVAAGISTNKTITVANQ